MVNGRRWVDGRGVGKTHFGQHLVQQLYSESELSGSFKRSLIICECQPKACRLAA